MPPFIPWFVFVWSYLYPDCGFGLVFRRQGLPKEQLEHSGWDAGVDLGHWHPGVAHLQHGHQDPGHAQGTEAAEDTEATAVSVVLGDIEM